MTVAISKPHTFVKEEMLKQPQVIKSDDLRLFHLFRTGSAPGGSVCFPMR